VRSFKAILAKLAPPAPRPEPLPKAPGVERMSDIARKIATVKDAVSFIQGLGTTQE
jgi:hypothetical protein